MYLTGGYDTAMKILDPYDEEEQKTKGHNLKLQKSRSRLDVRKYFFSQRVVNLWNDLSKEVVEAPSVDSFKSRLNKTWNSRNALYTPLDPSNIAFITAMQLWSRQGRHSLTMHAHPEVNTQLAFFVKISSMKSQRSVYRSMTSSSNIKF